MAMQERRMPEAVQREDRHPALRIEAGLSNVGYCYIPGHDFAQVGIQHEVASGSGHHAKDGMAACA